MVHDRKASIIHASEPLPGTLQIYVPVCINIKDRAHNLFKQVTHRSDGHWSTVALRLTCQRVSCLYFKHHLKNVNNWSCRSDINVLNKNVNIALQDIKKKSIAIRKINFYTTCFICIACLHLIVKNSKENRTNILNKLAVLIWNIEPLCMRKCRTI